MENFAKYVPMYKGQRKNARVRGIDFLLTFSEWLYVWQSSGQLPNRGAKSDQYVMGRYGDIGPYALGNVKIITKAQNVRESVIGFGNKHNVGKPRSKRIRRKISIANMGRAPTKGMSGKTHNQQTRLQISINKQGQGLGVAKSKQMRKRLSATRTGGHWITNGTQSSYLIKGDCLPSGWFYGRGTK